MQCNSILPELRIVDVHDTMISAQRDAAWPAGTILHTSQLSIGGVSIRTTADRMFGLPFSLEPFRADSFDTGIDLQVEWLSQLAPSSAFPLFDSGQTWKLYEFSGGLQFDFYSTPLGAGPYKRLLTQTGFHSALLQISEEFGERLGYAIEPLGYPLDELLIIHRLTHEKAIELHGVGIVGPDGASNLFVGHSGAGKSTTARLWTSLHKVDILSDDRIIVREHPAGEGATQIFMYGTPWHGEGCFALPQRAPLQRIFVLEHGHGNVLTRLTRSQMVAELFARAFVPFHRHEYVDSALSFLERVADTVPCYHYSFEPDHRAVERILNFRD
jgi:hypothetical protein